MAGFRINTNIPAIFSQRQLGITNRNIQRNLEKLSSGLRINRAADDAAGLAISERFRTQINGLKQASKNIQDGISLIQTAEGGIEQISDQLQRLRTLAVQAANDTLTTNDRALIQLEFNQILSEIDRQVSTVNFNTKVLLDGTYSVVGGTSLSFQVGANETETISVNIFTVSTAGLGIDNIKVKGTQTATQTLISAIISNATGASASAAGVVTRKGAESAITLISNAITKINGLRAELGAIQNRLERTFDFVQVQMENQAAAESRIRDLDFASEIVSFTKNQILQQAGTSALAQANVAPQSVLQLLR
ncbi:MAG: flagellin [Candidatus Hydrogenedentota bacterium]|nr:MAG: flagellin [Candidatus Hydrogenedentota bacterium]